MATKSEIAFKKFIADIKANKVPEQLKDLYQKIKIEQISTEKPFNTLITIPVFRRLFSISETTRLIKFYTAKTNSKQLTIFDYGY